MWHNVIGPSLNLEHRGKKVVSLFEVIDTVSGFKDIDANTGLFSGLLYTYVTSNRRRGWGSGGPWVVLAIGAVQCFAGYFLMWASVTRMIRKPPVPLMCLFMFLAAQSQTFFNTANVVSAVENFADYGGTVVGIMKVEVNKTWE